MPQINEISRRRKPSNISNIAGSVKTYHNLLRPGLSAEK